MDDKFRVVIDGNGHYHVQVYVSYIWQADEYGIENKQYHDGWYNIPSIDKKLLKEVAFKALDDFVELRKYKANSVKYKVVERDE